MIMTFKSFQAWTVFSSMAEAMIEGLVADEAPDPEELAEATAIDSMLDEMIVAFGPPQRLPHFPLAIGIDDAHREAANDVRRACLDNSSGRPKGDDFIGDDDVLIAD
jgi:hypothetical protein